MTEKPFFKSDITHYIYLKFMNSSNIICNIFLVKCLWCRRIFVFKKIE